MDVLNDFVSCIPQQTVASSTPSRNLWEASLEEPGTPPASLLRQGGVGQERVDREDEDAVGGDTGWERPALSFQEAPGQQDPCLNPQEGKPGREPLGSCWGDQALPPPREAPSPAGGGGGSSMWTPWF